MLPEYIYNPCLNYSSLITDALNTEVFQNEEKILDETPALYTFLPPSSIWSGLMPGQVASLNPIVSAAIGILNNKYIRKSYAYKYKWVFSPNQKLVGCRDTNGIKATSLSQYRNEIFKILENDWAKWPTGQFITYIGGSGDPDGLNKCNIFVFDVIYMAGFQNKIPYHNINNNRHYYISQDIDKGVQAMNNLFNRILNPAQIQPGDIVTMIRDKSSPYLGHHIEIVTKVDIQASTFKTIGYHGGDIGLHDEIQKTVTRDIIRFKHNSYEYRFYRIKP